MGSELKDLKYMQHFGDWHTTQAMTSVIEDVGVSGYGIFWILHEIISTNLKRAGDGQVTMSSKRWAFLCGCDDDVDLFKKTLAVLVKEKIVEVKLCKESNKLTVKSNILGQLVGKSMRVMLPDTYKSQTIQKPKKAISEAKNSEPIETPTHKPEKPLDVKNEALNGELASDVSAEIIKYLADQTGKEFSLPNENVEASVQIHLLKGGTGDDFKRVADLKVREWIGNETMNQRLTPQTLFVNKFNDYFDKMQQGSNSGASEATKSHNENLFLTPELCSMMQSFYDSFKTKPIDEYDTASFLERIPVDILNFINAYLDKISMLKTDDPTAIATFKERNFDKRVVQAITNMLNFSVKYNVYPGHFRNFKQGDSNIPSP